MKRYRFRFCGRVQGVGFRYFVYTKAYALGLSGYVKNLDDGTVEAEVEGEEDKIHKFLDAVLKGNGISRIDDIEREEIEIKGDKKFKILYY
ncbi:acylphosphatase [Caloramator sp. mosi_1]|uniref:acylphosphatase n=1 Tax=Caloramator sp. mosi_1 TaxID=3023090 RepID=UPI002360D2F3|nr:acylphosphatase [Caloramator sp. mosi_1]WDC84735.1 acylphosphatase [Caloramator sp. mosi_1]